MKRGLVILTLLLFLPSVYASINLESIERQKVNFGDKLDVSGTIVVSSDMFALLKLTLHCQQSEIPLLIRSLTLNANKEHKFSESLYISAVNEGICSIRTILERNGNIIDDTKSNSFTITKELSGQFTVPTVPLQLGDYLSIKGAIKRLNGASVNGFGTLYLKSNGTIAFADAVEIEDGSLDYSRSTTDMPAGSYSLQFDIQDSYGNKVLLDIGSINIINKLTITATINKELFLPGEKIEVVGSITKSDGNLASSGVVRADFNNQTFENTFSRGAYALSFDIPKAIRSGDHGIDIVVRDSFGNIGSTFLKASVAQVPTSIRLVLESTTLTPKGILNVKPVLYDQANDKIFKDLSVEVTDAKGKRVFSDNVPADKELGLELPQDAPPGEWAVTAKLDKLKETLIFTVVEKIDLNIKLVEQTLFITNIGNVKFKAPIDIIFIGSINTTKTKQLSLNVNETETIKLGSGLADGIYDVEVYGKTFNGVNIVGSRGYIWIFIVVIALLVLLLFHIIHNFFRLHRKHKAHLREFEKGKHTARVIIQHKKEEENEPKKKTFTEGAREFRDRILRNVITQEKEKTQKELREKFQKEYLKK